MSELSSIDEAIEFAEAVLNADPKNGFKVEHFQKYFSDSNKKKDLLDPNKNNRIVYAKPGQALSVEVVCSEDVRAGIFPQHNSQGDFPEELELNPSLKLDLYENLINTDLLEENDFFKVTVSLTQKRTAQIYDQFSHLSPVCFEEMMSFDVDSKQRDFDVYVKEAEDGFVHIAHLNRHFGFTQFFQSFKLNDYGEIIDLRHVVCEAGVPIVINQSFIDAYDNLRSVAHVGITGSKKNSFYNSLERFDDGSLIWTSSDFKQGKNLTGSAVLFEDGRIVLIKGSDQQLAQFSARNLGAEAINPKNLKWKGRFSKEGCISLYEDSYAMRREYKMQVKHKVNQIIDGACIPGFMPIFKVNV